MAGILIIDDDTFICKAIQKQLKNNGFEAEVAFSGNSGIKKLKAQPFDLVLCDFRLPDKDGLEVLQQIKRMDTRISVVIITAYADVRMAVKLMKLGATDYLTKPLQHEEIISLVKRLTRNKENPENKEPSHEFITGKSNAFAGAVKYAKRVAPTSMAVLIEGETGTGKEYVARYIHHHSKRSGKAFVALDCGAIPKELAGSELFGHVKGSFTGAVSDKTGVFQQADGGTLFLDEIGNLGYNVQVQLLRALQEKTINRIGENKPIKVDVRIIAATNENLAPVVNNKGFREDLFHRINEFKITLPPLRDREEDIVFFAEHFRKMANRDLDMETEGFSDETFAVFSQYEWPGNIRELKNVVRRAVLLTGHGLINTNALPEEIKDFSVRTPPTDSPSVQTNTESLKSASAHAEREMIMRAIEEAGYNKSKAARALNIDRKTLYNKLRQFDIDI